MPCEAIRNGSSIRGLMATCRNRSTHPPSPRSLTAFLLKVVRPPTPIRPMRANLRRKQGRRVQPAALPRSTALGFYLAFHFLHVLSFAQDTVAPSFTPEQLDKLVARIALYPDSLLAQVLAAATYPDQIPDAASWADQHHYLTGQALAIAIQADHLSWDPSVQALLPFPSVLEMMANDMSWTTDLGNAFLSQQQDVMDERAQERRKAKDYGYLRSNAQIIVSDGPYITIVPVHPAYIPVLYYDRRLFSSRRSPGS